MDFSLLDGRTASWACRGALVLAFLLPCPVCAPAGKALYERCDDPGTTCATGQCQDDPSSGERRCLTTCPADAVCPKGPSGPGSCVANVCVPPCDGPLPPGAYFCAGGAVHDCFGAASAPCDQCRDRCDSASFCASDGRCAPRFDGRATCEQDEECLSDSCKNGICNLTLNSPCVDGDPCQCVFGFCTQQCDGTFTDYRGGCPYGFACTDGYHPVQDPDVNTGRGWCHRECQDDPAACAAGQQCRIPPDYFSSTRIRACLWH